jgi:hypothetical protein
MLRRQTRQRGTQTKLGFRFQKVVEKPVSRGAGLPPQTRVLSNPSPTANLAGRSQRVAAARCLKNTALKGHFLVAYRATWEGTRDRFVLSAWMDYAEGGGSRGLDPPYAELIDQAFWRVTIFWLRVFPAMPMWRQ